MTPQQPTPPSATPAVLVVGPLEPRSLAALHAAGWGVMRGDDTVAAATGQGAIVVAAPTRNALAALRGRTALLQAGFDNALVVLAGEGDVAAEAALLGAGVEAIVVAGDANEADTTALVRAVRHAVARKAVERAARTAYATDLTTGLPHRAQLLEHMSQLLALREREPAPMVLLVLRVAGCAAAAAQFGAEAGNVLRRKVAVRLRSALRAGDVVAAIDADDFGVLLGHVESKGDGERVAAKLVAALRQPVVVAGQACRVGAAVGIAVSPDDGRQPQALLDLARAQAVRAAGAGAVLGTEPAANDDEGED